MKGRELIQWIQDNKAEDLPVKVKHVGGKDEEDVEPEVKLSIVGTDQLQYKKYFLI